MSVSISGSQVTFNDGSTQNTSAYGGGFAMRNRIINGAMVIDQRNAGASVTPSANGYTLDRWAFYMSQGSKFSIQQNAGSITPPAGFKNYLGATVVSAVTVGAGDYFLIQQNIEGFNTADLGFGAVGASTVSLSFWVRSSLTGTFTGRLMNGADNRSYVFTYTISAANTWEQKSVTIAGDTSGTWVGATNGTGLKVTFDLGSGSGSQTTAGSWQNGAYSTVSGATSVVGTNGATFYITGVQLEKGSTATSFDYRPYGTELSLCQRYYQVLKGQIGVAATTSSINWCTTLLVQMRASPSLSKFGGSNYVFGDMVSVAYGSTGTPTLSYGYNELCLSGLLTGFTGLTAYRSYRHEPTASGNDATLFAVSAEL